MNKEFKINNFDLLRLFAACEVLLIHSFPRLKLAYPEVFKIIMNFPGVTMFFVISGFLISASLERNQNLRNYISNRALRIYPALWVCIVLTVITISVIANISFFNKQAIPWYISQCMGIIYTPGFLSNYGFGSYNGSLWTIPLELQFYITLPVIYFLAAKITKDEKLKTFFMVSIFVFFCVITYFITAYYDGDQFEITKIPKILRYTFIPNIYLFLLGVVLQRFKVYRSKLVFGKGILWLVIYLIISYFIPTSTTTYIFKLLFLGLTTIALAYTLPATANKILRGNDISYGVYIYHGLVLGVIVQLKLFGNPNYIIVIVLITFLLATLSWKFVEKPFMKRKKKTIHEITNVPTE